MSTLLRREDAIVVTCGCIVERCPELFEELPEVLYLFDEVSETIICRNL